MSATVVVGVGAGIAAFKAATLVREFVRAGLDVRVVPTPASLEFVGVATWEALSGHPVHTGVFEAGGADHVELARIADLVVIAPATADLLARLRAGRADDLLTSTVLASSCPVVVAPAMHTAMWRHPATQDNVGVLADRGVHVIPPASGALSSGDSGEGRLPDPEFIAARSIALLEASRGQGAPVDEDLAGVCVVVTAGGTREHLDPVRFLGNESSGRQGVAIARCAAARGAHVTLVAANVEAGVLAAAGEDVEVVPVVSAADLGAAVDARLAECDVLVMAAAVADFTPEHVAGSKIKKHEGASAIGEGEGLRLDLVPTRDVLATVARSAARPRVLVGFAAETGDAATVAELGAAKARRKGADLLAVNAVGGGRGFGDVPNSVRVLDASGAEVGAASGSKEQVADALLDLVAARLA